MYGWKKNGNGHKAVPDPLEQAVLARMRKWREEGKSDEYIVGYLNRAGILHRGEEWDVETVGKVLTGLQRVK